MFPPSTFLREEGRGLLERRPPLSLASLGSPSLNFQNGVRTHLSTGDAAPIDLAGGHPDPVFI